MAGTFQKYHPPDFDPSRIPRKNGQHNGKFNQRVMTPFNMQCNTCKEHIYKGRKFNMDRETVEGETYLGLRIFRFSFHCDNCSAEITFKTDLENCDYKNEHGATRLFEAAKLYQDQQAQADDQDAEDALDPMKLLEKRIIQSRHEMEEMANLEDLQESNRTREGIDPIAFLSATDPEAQRIKAMEEEDDRMAKELMGHSSERRIERRIEQEDDKNVPEPGPSKPTIPTLGTDEGADSKKRLSQKDRLAGLKFVKKVEPVPAPSGLSLIAGYGSDSDAD